MKLIDILGGPLKEIVGAVGSLIDGLHTSGEEKLAAQMKLVEIERNAQLKVIELEQQWAQTQAEVIKAEAQSQSWLARNWRPILMLTFTYIIAHNYVIAPVFSVPSVLIPPDMWELLKIGVGGYVFGRTIEKSVATYTSNKK